MRRLSLSTKLIAAAMPLVLAVVALLALTVRSDLNDIQTAENGAELGALWDPLITALTSIEAEVGQVDEASNVAGRRATDQAINDLRSAVEGVGAFDAATEHITSSRSSLSAARRNLDMAVLAPELPTEIDPLVAYDTASRELVSVGQLLPSEAGDPELGRELLAVVKLAESKLEANAIIRGTEGWPNATDDRSSLLQARSAFSELDAVLGEFEAIAPEDWASQYRQSGFTAALGSFRTDLDGVVRAADRGEIQTFDTESFSELVTQGVQFQSIISQSIVDRANTEVDDTRRAVMFRIGLILAAVLLAAAIAWIIARSVTRRVRAVAATANQVASEQLPALVQALRDPRGKAVLPSIEPVDASGGDEVSELAEAFNAMQGTLVDVAHEQVEVLRRGVSDIFVTMARRNRSLIDRQLAMLDEYEAEVDDADVLSNYYQLDHLATRMRRNSESLLVLANAEPKRRRVKATEIDDVIRASIGEVEDYRRIDIEALESLQVKGNVVADISHLLAELLDNATSFSPPDSPVRVGGRHAGDSYMIRIVDSGVGVGPDRIRELNELLRDPPIVGLSVESTLGISVVSLLAHKHGVTVTLSAGNPGLTVDVVLPAALFGPIDVPIAAEPGVTADAEPAPLENPTIGDALVVMDVVADEFADDAAELMPAEAHSAPDEAPAFEPDLQPVAAGDASTISFDLSSFASGQAAADAADVAADHVAAVEAPIEAPAPVSAFEAPAESELQRHETPLIAESDAFDGIAAIAAQADDSPAVAVGGANDAATDSDDSGLLDALSQFDTENPLPARGLPDLPPPPAATRVHGEFDVPPAPPIGSTALTSRPVTPASARPAPTLEPAETFAAPGLPTRSPGRGPDGPDRLAAPVGDEPSVAAAGEPSALQAALAAFDVGRNADTAELPTRARVGDPVPPVDEPAATAQSQLDPDALRQRLRAFQTEFNTGLNEHDESDHTTSDNHSDLGGDRR